jgi:hypothetical protein
MFNTMADMAHKIFSPSTYSCNLCAITHSTFHMRREWKDYLESLKVPMRFLHRDEFIEAYGETSHAFPAIFVESPETMKIFISAMDINACKTMDDLKQLIQKRLDDLSPV